jgi:hypothetical protein
MKKLIFWDFPRTSWQYDVIVLLILAFIFLTPRDFFRDQPRAAKVVQVPTESGANVFWIEPHLLPANPEQQKTQAAELIRARTGKPTLVYRVEPITNSEEDVMGYMAYSRP